MKKNNLKDDDKGENNCDSNGAKNLQFIHEKAWAHLWFILSWRYKLTAGYFAVASVLFYFTINWISDKNYFNIWVLGIISLIGISLSILFYFIHIRITKLSWLLNFTIYGIERKMGYDNDKLRGPIGNIIGIEVRESYDSQIDKPDNKTKEIIFNPKGKVRINPENHFGAINILYIIGIVMFIALFIWGVFSYDTPTNVEKDEPMKVEINNFK